MRAVSTDQLNAVTRCSAATAELRRGGGVGVNQSAAAGGGKPDLLKVLRDVSPLAREASCVGGLTDWRPATAFNLSLAAVLLALRSHVTADPHVRHVTCEGSAELGASGSLAQKH